MYMCMIDLSIYTCTYMYVYIYIYIYIYIYNYTSNGSRANVLWVEVPGELT